MQTQLWSGTQGPLACVLFDVIWQLDSWKKRGAGCKEKESGRNTVWKKTDKERDKSQDWNWCLVETKGGGSKMWGQGGGEGGASPLMRGTSSRAQAHFLFLKVNRQPAGVWGVMGKEETVMLIRPAHTSPSNNKTKQEGKDGKSDRQLWWNGLHRNHGPTSHN